MAVTLVVHSVTTLEAARTWIGVESAFTDNDDLIKTLINRVTDYLERRLCRRVVLRDSDITEVWTGDGTMDHYLDHAPITAFTSLILEDETAVTVADADQFRKDDEAGRIYLINRIFTEGLPRNCTAVYRAGWAQASVPGGIVMLAEILIKRLYKLRDRQDEDIASIGSSLTGQTITRFDRLITAQEWSEFGEPSVRRRYA